MPEPHSTIDMISRIVRVVLCSQTPARVGNMKIANVPTADY